MILNLTQHTATADQKSVGVIEPTESDKRVICDLLTFNEAPDETELHERAKTLARIAKEYEVSAAMIGGAPFFMSTLEKHLYWKFIESKYAFSVRESVEETAEDGSVRKVNVFKHAGFVTV